MHGHGLLQAFDCSLPHLDTDLPSLTGVISSWLPACMPGLIRQMGGVQHLTACVEAMEI